MRLSLTWLLSGVFAVLLLAVALLAFFLVLNVSLASLGRLSDSHAQQLAKAAAFRMSGAIATAPAFALSLQDTLQHPAGAPHTLAVAHLAARRRGATACSASWPPTRRRPVSP